MDNNVTDQASIIIAQSTAKASAVAALPIPLADLAGVAYVQYQMVKKLAVEFKLPQDDLKFPLVGALVAGVLSKLSSDWFSSLAERLKMGSILNEALIRASVAGFLTTLVGEVYFYHFYHGGTIDDIDIQNFVGYIKAQLTSDRYRPIVIGHKVWETVQEKIAMV